VHAFSASAAAYRAPSAPQPRWQPSQPRPTAIKAFRVLLFFFILPVHVLTVSHDALVFVHNSREAAHAVPSIRTALLNRSNRGKRPKTVQYHLEISSY